MLLDCLLCPARYDILFQHWTCKLVRYQVPAHILLKGYLQAWQKQQVNKSCLYYLQGLLAMQLHAGISCPREGCAGCHCDCCSHCPGLAQVIRRVPLPGHSFNICFVSPAAGAGRIPCQGSHQSLLFFPFRCGLSRSQDRCLCM